MAKLKLRPLYDTVIVRREEEETVSSGGIVLPGSATEKPTFGTVLAVGDGRLDGNEIIPLEVKKGDKVLFGQYSGQAFKQGDEELLHMKESDIIAVVE